MAHFAAGDVRQRQRKTKARLGGTAANMVAALPTDGAESAWRTGAALQLIESLFPDQNMKAWSALTFAYLDARRITPEDLAGFFQDEVLDDELPRTRLMGVTDYLQRRYELTAGNWTDQGHAVELLYADVFVTRDATFARVLRDLSNYLVVRARVVLLDSSAPALEQLAAQVGEAKT